MHKIFVIIKLEEIAMEEEKYEIFVDGKKVGELTGLDNALIFVKGLFNEYYNDATMAVSLRRVREE